MLMQKVGMLNSKGADLPMFTNVKLCHDDLKCSKIPGKLNYLKVMNMARNAESPYCLYVLLTMYLTVYKTKWEN